MMRRKRHSSRREPTIALINVVFLMLVFFLVAGTISQPLDGDLKLVRTADLEGTQPPDTIVIHEDGRLSYRGQEIAGIDIFLNARTEEERQTVRLVPDRELSAERLVQIARQLRAAGAQSVMVVTEKAAQ